MNRTVLTLIVILTCSFSLTAQTQSTASGKGSVQTNASSGSDVSIQSGTQLSAELQKAIDVRHAKVGDQVILKTTEAIKSQERTIVRKGARLVGHVTDVAQKTKSNEASRIAILFDRIENGPLPIPISATIHSVRGARTVARANNQDLVQADAGGQSMLAAGSSSAPSGGSGLVGGVTNTVGGLASTTTSAVGSVTGGTTAAVGSTLNGTTSGVNGSLSGIQISESSNSSASSSSLLSLQGQNLRLERGTIFNLVISQATSVDTVK